MRVSIKIGFKTNTDTNFYIQTGFNDGTVNNSAEALKLAAEDMKRIVEREEADGKKFANASITIIN